jgi:hypothetical protein
VRRGTSLGVALLLAATTSLAPRPSYAQGQIQFVLPTDVPFPAAPRIGVQAVGFPTTLGTLRIRLRLSLTANIGLVLYDSTKFGPEASFTMARLLPESRAIFAEASVIDQVGNLVQSAVVLAGSTGPRLQLLAPNGSSGISLDTQQPRFVWRSAKVTAPPGPWEYELFVTNVATQVTRSRARIFDTVYTYPDTLEANTSYRWKVVAHLINGAPSDSAVASSASSFVIAPADRPLTTLLYQNFPNPFPTLFAAATCIWFDLQTASEVTLTIHDLRGHQVRTLIPGAQLGGVLPAGRYGRRSATETTGCDPRFAWDGTTDNGRTAPPGVYLVRFRAGGYESMKKMLFKAR